MMMMKISQKTLWRLRIASRSNKRRTVSTTRVAGGRFNRSAVVRFESSGDVLTIGQTFSGQDAQGHMRISTVLDGRVPVIAADAQVEVDDYYEEFRRTAQGQRSTKPISLSVIIDQPGHDNNNTNGIQIE